MLEVLKTVWWVILVAAFSIVALGIVLANGLLLMGICLQTHWAWWCVISTSAIWVLILGLFGNMVWLYIFG